MSDSTALSDALRLLAYRDHFPDFALALAKIGFTLGPGEEKAAAASADAPEDPPDEDEHVYAEPVDGWTPSNAEDWGPSQRQGEAEEARADDSVTVEAIDTYGSDWRPIPAPAPSSALLAGNRRDVAGNRGERRGSGMHQRRFVIAHILAPVAREESAPASFAYRSVGRRQRPRALLAGQGVVDDAAWRLAVECLSATSLKSRRRSIDIEACVNVLARWKAIDRLPMRDRGDHRAAASTLLRDVSLSNGPFGEDIAAFVASLRANIRQELEILGFSRSLSALGCGAGPIWTWRPVDISTLGQRVIAVSGVSPQAYLQRHEWQRFAEALIASGRQFAFVNVGELDDAQPLDASHDPSGWSWFTLVC